MEIHMFLSDHIIHIERGNLILQILLSLLQIPVLHPEDQKRRSQKKKRR